MKKILSLVVLGILMFGCKKDDNNSITYPINVPFTKVAKGYNYNANSKYPFGNKSTLTDSSQWNKVLAKLDSLISPNNPDIFIRTIDFNSYQLLSVVDSVRYSGGWSVDIVSIKEYQNNIEVSVANVEKGNSDPEVTQPYHIVRITKQTKPVIFK